MAATVFPRESPKHHYFKRFFNFNGRELHGYLTYTLDASGLGHRDAIIIDHSLDPVPAALRSEYSGYVSELARVRAKGVVGAAKRFLIDRDLLPENVADCVIVAVHKHGPVPAFDLKASVPVKVRDTIVQARLLCYVNPLRPHEAGDGIGDLSAFLASLGIAPRELFCRYFEDVAARMRDIVLHGNLRSTAMWLKEIESTIGQSITSKLRWIKPNSVPAQGGVYEWNRWRRRSELTPADELRRDFFLRHPEIVCFANHVRLAFLYLTNCVYFFLGMHSRREEYLKRMEVERDLFRDFFGYDVLLEARRSFPDLDDFCDALTALLQDDEQLLYQECVSAPWLQDSVEFMRHIYWIGKSSSDPIQPVFFVSHHHNDRKSELQAALITDFVNAAGAQALMIASDTNESKFKEGIKAAIWKSDRLVSVAVADPRDARSGVHKGYGWLAAESEYATHQAKQVIFALEEGPGLDFYRQAMIERPFSLLADSPRRTEDQRRQRLGREWQDSNHVHFAVRSRVLDIRIRSRLAHEGSDAAMRRRKVLLTSYFSLFDVGYVQILMRFFHDFCCEGGLARKEVVQLFKRARVASGQYLEPGLAGDEVSASVDRFLNYFRSNRRSLIVGGAHFYALWPTESSEGRRRFTYRCQLLDLVRILFPDLRSDEHLEILNGCAQEARDLHNNPNS